MAETKVRRPDGVEVTVSHPEGATKEEIFAFAEYQSNRNNSGGAQPRTAPVGEDLSWPSVAGGAITGFPSSAVQQGKNLGQAIIHPWDTAASVLEVGTGAISQFFPDFFENSTLQEAEEKAGMVGQAMVKKYGGLDNFKRTLKNDSASVLADVAGLLSGGGGLAAKAGMMTAKTANKVNEVANWIDPISGATKSAIKTGKFLGRLPKAVPGHLSGLGEDAVTELYKAGREGGKSKKTALGNMRDPSIHAGGILDWANAGVEKLKTDRRNTYRSGMVDVKNDATVLDFGAVEDAFRKVVDDNTFLDVPKSKSKAAALEEISAEIAEWKSRGPDYWTPEGMDTLKQRIGDLTDWNNKDKASNQSYLQMYDSVREVISNQAPVYGTIMKDYSDATRHIKELEKTLSLKDTASADTTFRKLASSLKNNVNTNFGQRAELVGDLQGASGEPLKAAIAGQAASSITPRGIQGLGATGNLSLMALQGLNAWQIPLLAAQSPRIVGETAVALGSGVRRTKDMAGKLTPSRTSNTQRGRVEQATPALRKYKGMARSLIGDPRARAIALQAGRVPRVIDEEEKRRTMLNALGAN
tara:strand:- start:24 stop:1775 length:1752 start_codon:yes stop_codon:yes gene_type:complete